MKTILSGIALAALLTASAAEPSAWAQGRSAGNGDRSTTIAPGNDTIPERGAAGTPGDLPDRTVTPPDDGSGSSEPPSTAMPDQDQGQVPWRARNKKSGVTLPPGSHRGSGSSTNP